MPASGESIERMELTFRANPTATRSTLPGGWMLWCLLGCAMGIGGWFAGRQQLSQSFRDQLSQATTSAQAWAAIDGLATLSPEASLEIVAGLENPDPVIARTAFRRLEDLLALWQTLDSTTATRRYEQLARRLDRFAPQAPPDNQRLASTLASRLYGVCYADGSPAVANTLELCRKIIDRNSGLSEQLNRLEDEIQRTAMQVERTTNPLAGSATLGNSRAGNSGIPAEQLLETSTAPRNIYRLSDDNSGSVEPAVADGVWESLENVPVGGMLQPQPAPTERSAADGTAKLSLLVGPTQPRSPTTDFASNVSQATNIPSISSGYAPVPSSRVGMENRSAVVVATPASLSNTPLVRMKVVSDQPDLDGIQQLSIEELVRLLASQDPRVAQGAALALRSKGMDDRKIALASELAGGTASQRLALVQQIAIDSSLLPEPWLLWMAEDGEPEVRRMSVSLLSSMLNPDVERTLRILLARERDPQVADTIRQTLLAGRGSR